MKLSQYHQKPLTLAVAPLVVVNLSHITKIDGNTIYLSNKTTQTISRRYVTNVKTKYIKYITTGGNL